MTRDFPEVDWKLFRRLQDLALERFCQRVLVEVAAITADTSQSSHKRYVKIFRVLDERDDQIELAFNNPRRSAALMQLAHIREYSLLTDEEFAEFSTSTRAAIRLILGDID